MKGKIEIGMTQTTKGYSEEIQSLIKVITDKGGEITSIDSDVLHGVNLSQELVDELKSTGHNVTEEQ